MEERIHHVGLFARNQEDLIDFYTQKLGFTLLGEKVVEADHMASIFGVRQDCPVAKLRRQDVILEIFAYGGLDDLPAGSASPGVNHCGLAVDAKDSFLTGIREEDIDVFPVDFNGRVIHFIRDPEGNLIELYEASP